MTAEIVIIKMDENTRLLTEIIGYDDVNGLLFLAPGIEDPVYKLKSTQRCHLIPTTNREKFLYHLYGPTVLAGTLMGRLSDGRQIVIKAEELKDIIGE